ncbi:MAG: SCO family protein [Alphaproteobacteria bacterium]
MRRLLIVSFVVAMAVPAWAHDGTEEAADDAAAALAVSQGAIGRTVRDLALGDGAGRRFMLSDLRGRPVVLSPIYTSCAHTCPLVTQALAKAVEAAEAALGPGRFTVLTIGFDAPNDTPVRMAAYGRQQGVGGANWRFVAGDAPAIARLLDDIGLVVRPVAGGFDHVAQVTILDAEGRVAHQVYGDGFAPRDLADPLLDLVLRGSTTSSFVESVIDRVVLFCTVYDPATGAYRFDYSLFVELAVGGFSILAVAGFLWREVRRRAASRAA